MALKRTLGALVLLLAACVTERGPTLPLAIERIAIEPKELRLDQGKQTTLRFEISRPARVVVEMRTETGEVVERSDLGEKPAGAVEATWDGRDLSGAPVPSGVYLYRITASDGTSTVASAPVVPGGREVLAQRFTFDRETNTMRFVLPQASRVRLRVGMKGYPLLRTLYDWTPMLAGPHEIRWDGSDEMGLVEVTKQAQLDVNLSAFALPGNALLVTGNGPLDRRPAGAPAEMPGESYRHALHTSEICREPRFRVELVGARRGKSGLPVVSGVAPLRVTLDPSNAVHLVDTRFEIMVFIDTVLFESEDGSNPFNHQLDTSALAPGPHLLTVNVLGYDDHFGTHTIRFERGADQ